MSQGALGRIPWSRARDYALCSGVESDMLGAFWRIIFALDSAYLDQQTGEYNKAVAAQKSAARRSKSKRYGR